MKGSRGTVPVARLSIGIAAAARLMHRRYTTDALFCVGVYLSLHVAILFPPQARRDDKESPKQPEKMSGFCADSDSPPIQKSMGGGTSGSIAIVRFRSQPNPCARRAVASCHAFASSGDQPGVAALAWGLLQGNRAHALVAAALEDGVIDDRGAGASPSEGLR